MGVQDCLYLGNLNAKRDWGHAKDYVEAMWLMLQQDKAEDYVIATGTTTSVRRFVQLAFAELGIELAFEGSGVNEIGRVKSKIDSNSIINVGDVVVRVDPQYYRPTEVELLVGDPSKAQENLGWKPKTDLAALVKEMVQEDMLMQLKRLRLK